MLHTWRGILSEHGQRLGHTKDATNITLGEGGTPLIPLTTISQELSCDIYGKFEGMNPTGSFKDRGMAVAVSRAVQRGASTVLCASTGNTSASAAAYAAAANIKCVVLLPSNNIAPGKLAQSMVHGADLVSVDDNFDACLRIAQELHENHPVALVNSVNPDRIDGQRTAAWEIVAALGDAPDIHCLPVGNAGNITAYWAGYTADLECGNATKTPAMWGVQAQGAAPFVAGGPVQKPETIATAIRIGKPASWEGAQTAAWDSGGEIWSVSDAEILLAQRKVAETSGIFAEPASVAPIAGLIKKHQFGQLPEGLRIVVTFTGHGLKDIHWASHDLTGPTGQIHTVEPTSSAVLTALGM